jgi:repressor LexA
MKSLTPEQARVLEYITGYHSENGRPPTIREIAGSLGYRSLNGVRQHLRLIERKGYLSLIPNTSRGIELITTHQSGQTPSESIRSVPIIGTIAAGKPITAEENFDGHIGLDTDLFRGEGLFTLRVRGDSMVGIGVLDGDYVIARHQQTANSGDIVVAIIDGDATLKRYVLENGQVLLRAENPSFSDIPISPLDSFQIAGKMVGILRKC